MQTHLDKAPFNIRPARHDDMPHLFWLQDACRCSLQASHTRLSLQLPCAVTIVEHRTSMPANIPAHSQCLVQHLWLS